MRLTDAQIIATVDAMRMDDFHKATLKQQALGGDQSARFVVFGAYRRQTASR